jgi:hypothetical protein
MENKKVNFPIHIESAILSAFHNPIYNIYKGSHYGILDSRKFYTIHDSKVDSFLTNLLGLNTSDNTHMVNTMVFNFRWDIQHWEVAS